MSALKSVFHVVTENGNAVPISDQCLQLSGKWKSHIQFPTTLFEHFTISHKWQNWTSLVKYHNSIPGVYYAIIHGARKQIPLTWFIFNYSTWKSFLLSPSSEPEQKLLYPLEKKKEISTYSNCISSSLSDSIGEKPPSTHTLFKPEQIWHTTQWGYRWG